MGAYLSKPNCEKLSEDFDGEFLRFGASSMQGWRISQEDAHCCIVDYDVGTSLFGVYDGHGGSEVAQYTAERFPDFLKKNPKYTEGKMAASLEEAFLGFDATLTSDDVKQKLAILAQGDNGPEDQDEDVEEAKNEAIMLREEASMPIEKLLERYGGANNPANRPISVLQKSGTKKTLSPFIRPKQDNSDNGTDDKQGLKLELDDSLSSENSNKVETSLEPSEKVLNGSCEDVNGKGDTDIKKDEEPSSVDDIVELNLKNKEANGTSEAKCKSPAQVDDDNIKSKASDLDSGEKSEVVASSSDCKEGVSSSVDEHLGASSSSTSELPGASSSSTSEHLGASSSSTSEHLGASSSSTSEHLGASSSSTSEHLGASSSSTSELPGASSSSTSVDSATQSSSSNCDGNGKKSESSEEETTDESEDSDEDEEQWKEGEDDSDDDDDVDGCEDDDEDSDDEDDDDDDDDEDDAEEMEEGMNFGEEPGADSGCTAVVAMLHGNELYVANAGDSRCVVCRAGKAVEMSVDHKPEDATEQDRILKAGGRVTCDGRVNGGLNLSRAIGDHIYKRNTSVEAREQMITSLPDVRSMTLDVDDQFMVLACDGIWNVMSSQDVVDFVSRRLESGVTKLSAICEEMFDFCLAPDTTGDGTGCDNMTCVIVSFRGLSSSVVQRSGFKRKADSMEDNKVEPDAVADESEATEAPAKRLKGDE